MRRFGILWLLLSLCLVTQAQSETWQAWVYDPGTTNIIRVDGNGAILQQDTLPLAVPDLTVVRVSPSGTRMAYISYAGEHETLVVYDARPDVRKILVQHPLPPLWAETIEFNGFYAKLFSDDESQLAFSYTISNGGGWEILVFDLETGEVTQTLRSGEGIASDLPTTGREMIDVPIVPIIRDFDGRSVAFTIREPDATGRVWESYRWDTQQNQIISAPAYAVLEMDIYSPTGEIVQTLRDPKIGKPHIALYESGADTEAEVIFDSDPEYPADEPVFIQNGTAIAYKSYIRAPGWGLYILRRGASEAELWEPGLTENFYRVYGTVTGFVYTQETTNPDGTLFLTFYDVSTVNELGVGLPFLSLPLEERYKTRVIWFNDPRLTASSS